MFTISSLALILSLILAYTLVPKDLLGKTLKALMAMTFFASALLLSFNLGYAIVSESTQDGIRLFSAGSFIVLGMFLNSHGRRLLVATKGACFFLAAMHILNCLIANGHVLVP